MKWMYLFLQLNSPPPVRSLYHSQIHFPIIGSQHIMLQINSQKKAHIELKGILNIQDDIEYTYANGNFEFNFSSKLQKFLDKYHCHIENASYDKENDIASVSIKVRPIRYHHRVQLLRVKGKRSALHSRS